MTTYSISLDDVDLALLPLRTSYNNFLKKDHYNFEVKKTVTFEVPEPRNIYKCHICAIDMPASFAREHTASIKHRANAGIASVAARRMFALITALPPPSDEQPAARFCTNCATLADEHHDNTKEHQDAVKYDALLWDLMKAYAQNDKEFPDNEGNQDSDINQTNEHKNDDAQHGNGHTTNNGMVAHSGHKNQLMEQGDEEPKQIQVEDIATKFEINNNLKQQSEDDEFEDDMSDDNSMRSNFTENNDTIVTINSSDDQVESQIGYPYEIAAAGHVKCVVCDCKVTGGDRNREEHVRGRKHRNMKHEILKNLEENNEDEESIDDSDNVSVSDDITQPNAEVNTTTLSDVVDLKIEYPYEVTPTGQVRCVVCDCQVPSGIYNRDQHAKGMRHRNMVFDITQKTVAVDEKDQEDSSEDEELNTALSAMKFQIGYPYEVTTTGRVRCVVCNCPVPGGERNRDQHMRGSRHRNMVMSVKAREEKGITENHPEEYSKNKELVDENTVNNVTNGDNIESLIEYPFKVTETGHVHCVICNSQVVNSVRDREEHIKEARHREIEEFKTELETFRSDMSERMSELQMNML